ncbi:MAG: bifunctional RNase H/acid phosphatase [Actinomycetaceae bacterium]
MTRRLLIHTDGGARGNPGPAGYGAAVTDATTGERLATRSGFLGSTTNNVAEYTALVEGLRAAARIDDEAEVEVRADSKLVVEQMSGRWKIKHEDMRRLAVEARDAFPAHRVTYTWIPRAQNSVADGLANDAMDSRADASTDEWLTSLAPTAELGSESDDAWPSEPGGDGPTALFEVEEPAPAAPRAGEPTRVYLVRHGVTDWTVTGRQSGSDTPGPDLTDLGRRQARDAGRLLARLAEGDGVDLTTAEVRVSPIIRTRQSAEELVRAAGLGEPVVDDRLREVRFGEWDGLTEAEIEDRWPGELARWRSDADAEPPGGESHRAVGARIARVLQEVAGTEGRAVVLVTHSVVTRAAVSLVARMSNDGWGRVRVRPGSVTMLAVSGLDANGRLEGQVSYVGAPSESVG